MGFSKASAALLSLCESDKNVATMGFMTHKISTFCTTVLCDFLRRFYLAYGMACDYIKASHK